jgi:hypothetical protein
MLGFSVEGHVSELGGFSRGCELAAYKRDFSFAQGGLFIGSPSLG